MRTAEVPMESILTMLSTLSPENKTWLGHRLLNDAEEDDEGDFHMLSHLEIRQRLAQSKQDWLEGRIYTTEEVLEACKEDARLLQTA